MKTQQAGRNMTRPDLDPSVDVAASEHQGFERGPRDTLQDVCNRVRQNEIKWRAHYDKVLQAGSVDDALE